MSKEDESYFGKKAKWERENLKRIDKLRSEALQKEHEAPNGKLTPQQIAAINHGFYLPTSGLKTGQKGFNRNRERKNRKR